MISFIFLFVFHFPLKLNIFVALSSLLHLSSLFHPPNFTFLILSSFLLSLYSPASFIYLLLLFSQHRTALCHQEQPPRWPNNGPSLPIGPTETINVPSLTGSESSLTTRFILFFSLLHFLLLFLPFSYVSFWLFI